MGESPDKRGERTKTKRLNCKKKKKGGKKLINERKKKIKRGKKKKKKKFRSAKYFSVIVEY